MLKKIYIGIAIGTLLGLAVPVILKFRKERELFSDEDLSDDGEHNSMLDEANDFLLSTRKKVNEMVKDAEIKSGSILNDAATILSKAKDKTSEIHYDMQDSARDEINKLKEEIEKSIVEFKKKLDSE
ncbi:MAG: hypothetical protein ABI462_10815 [Ignavibacteria bacterium]